MAAIVPPPTLPALSQRAVSPCTGGEEESSPPQQCQARSCKTRSRSHFSRRRRLNEAMEAHNGKVAALHRANATGVSFLVESPVHTKLPTAPLSKDVGRRVYSRDTDDQSVSTSECDRSWSQHTFARKQPTGRQDALDLRAWLHSQLEVLNASTQGHLDKTGMLKYAEKAMDLYNAAFHELTRQVSISCTERGRLMADVWTSHGELASRIIADLRSHDDAHSAMANALHRKQKMLSDACSRLQEKCQQAGAENALLQARVAELESSVKGAERAAYGLPNEA